MKFRYLEFVWLPTFERTAADLFVEDDRRALELALLEDPERGAVMRRTGGFRKLRFGARGKGKSGGARVIYLHIEHRETVYMVLAYGKGTKDDLTELERGELKRLATIIKQGRR